MAQRNRRNLSHDDEPMREDDAVWWVQAVYASGLVAWLAAVVLVTCRIVDYYTR
jgi:hypothetical protein